MMLLTWVGRSEQSMKALRVRLGSSGRGLWRGELNCCKPVGPGMVGRDPPHETAVLGVVQVAQQLLNKGSFFSYHYTRYNTMRREEWEPLFPPCRQTTQRTPLTHWVSPFSPLHLGLQKYLLRCVVEMSNQKCCNVGLRPSLHPRLFGQGTLLTALSSRPGTPAQACSQPGRAPVDQGVGRGGGEARWGAAAAPWGCDPCLERRGFKLVGMKVLQVPECPCWAPLWPAEEALLPSPHQLPEPRPRGGHDLGRPQCAPHLEGHYNTANWMRPPQHHLGRRQCSHQRERYPFQPLCGGGPERDLAVVPEQWACSSQMYVLYITASCILPQNQSWGDAKSILLFHKWPDIQWKEPSSPRSGD